MGSPVILYILTGKGHSSHISNFSLHLFLSTIINPDSQYVSVGCPTKSQVQSIPKPPTCLQTQTLVQVNHINCGEAKELRRVVRITGAAVMVNIPEELCNGLQPLQVSLSNCHRAHDLVPGEGNEGHFGIDFPSF